MENSPLHKVTVTLEQAKDFTVRAIQAKLVPFIQGPPAAGKSAVVRQIANEFGLKLIDLRLSQVDPVMLTGFPRIDEGSQRASFAPLASFPLEGDEVPEGYNGWLIFFDELNSAPRTVQAASYKILHEREIDQHKIHPKVAMVAAGNRMEDNAVVEPMSTALQSRLIHMEVDVDADVWLDWAQSNGIDHRITSYIKFKPSVLYTFNPDGDDNTYASPRTWEYCSRLIQDEETIDRGLMPLLAGTVSVGVAREFIAHTKIYTDLPSFNSIITRPEETHVPEEPGTLYALTGSIASKTKDTNLKEVLKYTNRLPKEFEIICIKEVFKRNPDIRQNEAMKAWLTENAAKLF